MTHPKPTANATSSDTIPSDTIVSDLTASAAPHRRGWLRLHFSTWLILALMAVGLVVLNWGAFKSYDLRRPSGNYVIWEHGWPWGYLARDISDFEARGASPEPSSWSFAGGDPTFEPLPLLGNLAFAVGLLFIAGYLLERRRRRLARFWQFGLLHFLGLTAIVAALAATYHWQRRLYEAEDAIVKEVPRPESGQLPGIYYCKRQTRGPYWVRSAVQGSFLEREVGWGDRVFEAWTKPRYLDRAAQLTDLRVLRTAGPLDPDSLEPLQQLSQLQFLRISGGSHHATLPRIPPLPRLCALDVVEYRWNGAGLEHLPELEVLSAYDCWLEPDFWPRVAGCSRLQYLELYGTNVGDADLPHLAHCRNLKWLSLGRTRFDESAIRRLGAALPDCEIVANIKMNPELSNVQGW